MLKIFIGYDHRQPVSYTVLQHSIYTRSTKPVSITPLVLSQLPIKRQGLTPFTYSRFLVPWLCGYKGWALFLDIDMLVRDDISKLFDAANDDYAVMVSKNKLRFEWASAMLFNCEKCKILTPEYIDDNKNKGLHTLIWASPREVGEFDGEWNHLVGYDEPRASPKLIHYTQGVPAFPETEFSEHAAVWNVEQQAANCTVPWAALMASSVHAKVLPNGRPVPKFWPEASNDI